MSFDTDSFDDYNLYCDHEGNVVNNDNDKYFKRAVRFCFVAFDSEISNCFNEDDDVEEEYESTNNSIDYGEFPFPNCLKVVKISKGRNRKEKTAYSFQGLLLYYWYSIKADCVSSRLLYKGFKGV